MHESTEARSRDPGYTSRFSMTAEERSLLFPREAEAMDAFGLGLSLREVAIAMHCRATTAAAYRNQAMRKLGRSLGRSRRYWIDDDETPAQARSRVAADVSAGSRCPICHLLAPCGGNARCGLLDQVNELPRSRRSNQMESL